MKNNLKSRTDKRTVEKTQENINAGTFTENYVAQKIEYIFNQVCGYEALVFTRVDSNDSKKIIINKGMFVDPGDFWVSIKNKNGKMLIKRKVEIKSKSSYINHKYYPDDPNFRLKAYQIEKYIDNNTPVIAANRVFSSKEKIRLYTPSDLKLEIVSELVPQNVPPVYGNKNYYLINDNNYKFANKWADLDNINPKFIDDFIFGMSF